MIWTDSIIVYQITMSNNYMPFYYDQNGLYFVTSWSFGTTMFSVDPKLITNKAEGKEILSYGD